MANREVPGRSPSAAGADPRYCQICIEGGNCVAADAYCTVCKEFMCSVCSNVHRRQRATRSHHQLDKENMPITANAEEVHENLSEHCETHLGELIKYFCPEHQALLCGDCVALDQHMCKLEAIANAAINFKDSSAYKDIQTHIRQLANDACQTTLAVEEKAMDVDNSEQKDKTEVLGFQSTVAECFKEKFYNLTCQITTASQEMKIALTHLQERSKDTEAEASGLKADLEDKENNSVLLFIYAYKSKGRATAIPAKLRHIEEELNKIPTYKLKLDVALQSLSCIGTYRNSANKQDSDEMWSDKQKAFQAKILEAEDSIADLKDKHAKLQNLLNQTEKKCQELQARHKVDEDQLKVNLQQSQAQAAVLRQEVKSKEDQLKGKEQDIQALSRDAQNKSKEIDRLKQTSKEQDQNLSRQKEDVRKLEASLQKSQARVTSLEQKIIRNASLIGYTVEDVDSLEEDEEWEDTQQTCDHPIDDD